MADPFCKNMLWDFMDAMSRCMTKITKGENQMIDLANSWKRWPEVIEQAPHATRETLWEMSCGAKDLAETLL